MTNDDEHQHIIYNVLRNSIRIFFLEDESSAVRDPSLFSHGGIEGTFRIVDVTSLPEHLSKRDMETRLKEMGNSMPVLCIAKYQCISRDAGDFKLDLLSTNGEKVVSLERKKRLGVLWLSDGDKEIPVKFADGTVASVVRVDKVGNSVEIGVAGEDGLYFRRWIPSWQASTKWLLCAFLCFLPTFGLGGCFGFYKAAKADIVTMTTKNHRGTVVDLGTSIQNIIRFEGASNWKEKLTLLSLGAYMLTDNLTQPPVSQ